MAKKFYAVREGRKKGIYLSWEECKEQVIGYSGAEYKSFPTMEEAKAYTEGRLYGTNNIQAEPQSNKSLAEGDTAIAYVDGSYNSKTREFSCGAVLFYKGEKLEFSKKYNDKEMAEMRNVAGEIMGAATVIEYCLENEIMSLEIYHDYAGISKWATGEWKTNKKGTKAYAEMCKMAGEKLKLSFVKVKGHSGDKYNDEADILAKKALGL